MRPASAPTERSICPATMTSTIPMARIEVTDICRASSERLRGIRNVPSVVIENTIQITARAPTMVSARHGMRGRGIAAATGDGAGSMTGWFAAIRYTFIVAAAMTVSGLAPSAARSAVARPRLSTRTRWLIPSSSGRSEETSTTPSPGLREGRDELVDLRLRAHVDPARRLVQEQHPRVRHEPLPQHDLLLVAARELVDDGEHPRRLDAQRVELRLHLRLAGRVIEQPAVREPRQRGQGHVLRDRRLQHEPVPLAVFAHQGQAGRDRLRRAFERPPDRAPAHRQAPRHPAARGAEERADEGGASGAHEAADAQHLALAHFEVDVVQHLAARVHRVLHRPALDLEQGLARGLGRARVEVLHLAADHHRDHLVRGELAGAVGGHRPAVAQHGDAVRDLEDLLQAVADVDGRHAPRPQLADDGQQPLRIRLGQGGGGLVEDEDARVLGQRLGDLDHLLLADAQLLHRPIGVDVQSHAGEGGLGVGRDRVPVDEAAPHRLVPQHQVLRHRELGDESQLLGDERDAVRLGGLQGAEVHGLPAQEDLAAVGPAGIEPAEDLDQRALAGAVFAAERVDLALLEVEGNAVEGADAGELLRDRAELEERHQLTASATVPSGRPGRPAPSCGSRRRSPSRPCCPCPPRRAGGGCWARRSSRC